MKNLALIASLLLSSAGAAMAEPVTPTVPATPAPTETVPAPERLYIQVLIKRDGWLRDVEWYEDVQWTRNRPFNSMDECLVIAETTADLYQRVEDKTSWGSWEVEAKCLPLNSVKVGEK